MRVPPKNEVTESGGVARLGLEPRPYRDECAGAIARAAPIASTTGALEVIFDLGDAGAAAGARAALTTDLLDRVRTIGDGGIQLAVTDGMAQTDDHVAAPSLKVTFKPKFVKGDQNTR
jgi:hypothetical protein